MSERRRIDYDITQLFGLVSKSTHQVSDFTLFYDVVYTAQLFFEFASITITLKAYAIPRATVTSKWADATKASPGFTFHVKAFGLLCSGTCSSATLPHEVRGTLPANLIGQENLSIQQLGESRVQQVSVPTFLDYNITVDVADSMQSKFGGYGVGVDNAQCGDGLIRSIQSIVGRCTMTLSLGLFSWSHVGFATFQPLKVLMH